MGRLPIGPNENDDDDADNHHAASDKGILSKRAGNNIAKAVAQQPGRNREKHNQAKVVDPDHNPSIRPLLLYSWIGEGPTLRLRNFTLRLCARSGMSSRKER